MQSEQVQSFTLIRNELSLDLGTEGAPVECAFGKAFHKTPSQERTEKERQKRKSAKFPNITKCRRRSLIMGSAIYSTF